MMNVLLLSSLFAAASLAAGNANEALGPGYAGNNTDGTETASGTEAGAAAGTAAENPWAYAAGQPAGETGNRTAYNASVSFEEGRVSVDPLIGLVPDVHAQMKTGDGNFTDGFTTNMQMFNSPMDGFCGLYCRLENGIGDVFYRVYTEEHGWTRWAMNEMNTDWFNDAAKVTAIQLRIKGHTRNQYDLYYRVKLNDGTELDWAHDGQTSGTIGTGKYIQKIQLMLWKHDMRFYQPTKKHFLGTATEGIVFGSDGSVTYSTADRTPYTGWAYDTDNNKYWFENSRAVAGWKYIDGLKYFFDAGGRLVTDLEPVLGLTGDYIIKVNKEMKNMVIFTRDGDGDYTVPYKTFLCTIGSDTLLGTFKLYEPHRWKFMHDDIYVQYLLRYKEHFCIHSIIYRPVDNPYNLVASTYNQLGKNYSDGCIRLRTGDAAWLFENCGAGTMLEIYEDEWIMGAFDRPAVEQAIPDSQRYDPTDPAVIRDMAEQTGPFASGTYDGTGYEQPLPPTEENAAVNESLTEG